MSPFSLTDLLKTKSGLRLHRSNCYLIFSAAKLEILVFGATAKARVSSLAYLLEDVSSKLALNSLIFIDQQVVDKGNTSVKAIIRRHQGPENVRHESADSSSAEVA